MVKSLFLALSLLAATPAHAVWYIGNPGDVVLCGFVEPNSPHTHWDGNDAPADQSPGRILEGATPTEWSTISVSCDRSWASVSFGADEVSGDPWRVKVYGHSSGPGYQDDAVCNIYHGSNLWVVYNLHLRY